MGAFAASELERSLQQMRGVYVHPELQWDGESAAAAAHVRNKVAKKALKMAFVLEII